MYQRQQQQQCLWEDYAVLESRGALPFVRVTQRRQRLDPDIAMFRNEDVVIEEHYGAQNGAALAKKVRHGLRKMLVARQAQLYHIHRRRADRCVLGLADVRLVAAGGGDGGNGSNGGLYRVRRDELWVDGRLTYVVTSVVPSGPRM
jgi:hypothetical protein